jgi:hypothetical protein
MNSQDPNCEKFENGFLLFIDRELPEDQLAELSSHVKMCGNCSKLLADTIDIIYSGKNNQIDIPDDLFDVMIAKSVGMKSHNIASNSIFPGRKEKFIFYWKIAFASLLIFASITISLISTRTNPVKQVSHELLDWEGAKINTDLKTLETAINAMDKDDWDTKINQIDHKLDQLEKQTDKYSFN